MGYPGLKAPSVLAQIRRDLECIHDRVSPITFLDWLRPSGMLNTSLLHSGRG